MGASAPAWAQCKQLDLTAPHWQLVFADEFLKPTLNDSLWTTTPGGLVPNKGKYAGWGCEYYPQPGDADYDPRLMTITAGDTDSTAKGVLHLTALPLRMEDSIDTETLYNKTDMRRFVKYKSAIIRSKTDYPAYGAYIMRARLPYGHDYQAWATFWLWSCATEIDIVDGVGVNSQGRTTYLSNVIDNIDLVKYDTLNDVCLSGVYAYPELVDYTPGTRKNKAREKRAPRLHGPNPAKNSVFDTSFNTYAMVWTPQQVTLYFNGVAFLTVPKTKVRTLPKWNTILVSLQMFVRANMEKSYTMDVDYVRVYKINRYKSDGKTPDYESIVCDK